MKSGINNPKLQRIAHRMIEAALLVLALILPASATHAALVYNTGHELLSAGDFNGDSLADVLVLDQHTGNARVGFQNVGGTIDWAPPMTTGADPVTALAVGRFAQTNRDAIAVTAPGLNRIYILNLSNPTNTPVLVNPAHPDITLLVGLDAPYGTNDARSWLDTGAHDPGIMLLDLLAFVGDSLVAFQDQVVAEGYLSSATSFRRTTSDATLLAAMRREGSNDTFVVYSYTNTAGPIHTRSNLSPNTEYIFGNFNNENSPRLLFYVPGQSNVIVQALTNTGAGFAFGTSTLNSFASPIRRLFVVDEQTNGLVLIHFETGVVSGLRVAPGTDGDLELSAGYAVDSTGNEVKGVAPFGIGKFVLLSGVSNLLSSTHAQIFSRDDSGNYLQTASDTLSTVTTATTRGNVWLFPSEPFVSANASVIASFSAPAWSGLPSGLPGSLSVRAETDAGPTSGLGSPTTNNFGAPPVGTAYALPNQYREDISIFSYASARAPEPSVVTISPSPGLYTGPIQISFSKMNSSDEVFFRKSATEAWQLYAGSFALTNDATIEYYGSTLSGARSRSQFASYSLALTLTPPEPPVTLPGSETNQPPILNTNGVIISAGGTVFYSRLPAEASTATGFSGPSSYVSFANSPFSVTNGDAYFYLENFEDSALNTPGAIASPGWVVANPGFSTDSVDADDGSIDGTGYSAHSYYSSGQTNLTITFNAAALGGRLPTQVGIVWTDVGVVSSGAMGFGNVMFSARDANGLSLGTIVGSNLGDGTSLSLTSEDRFFGITHPDGISSISITMTNSGDWEVDHLQYGYLDPTGLAGTIWAINLDGSGETFVTTGARPRVSPDGRWLAFLREGGSIVSAGNLWVRDLATGVETRIYTNSDSIQAMDWNWPQMELVFDNACALWRTTFTGPAQQLPLALTPECFNSAPVVNPMDGRLAFQNLNPGAVQGVYVSPPDWSGRTQLSEPNPLRLRWPAWSPDGTRLAMADRVSSAFLNTGVNLWTASANGSNLRQITALTEPDGFPRGAVWTHDGRALVGAGQISGTNGLWVIPVNADGSACHCPPRMLPLSAGNKVEYAGSVVGKSATVTYTNLGLFIRLEPDTLVVYWSSNYEGFVLQSAQTLPAGFSWSPVTGPYFRAGFYFEHRRPRSELTERTFFRLASPGVLILTPSEPQLGFQFDGNEAVVTWPLNYAGYKLEASTNLAPPVIWTPLDGPYLNTNGVFEFRRALPGLPQEFYRLRWP